MKTHLFWPVLWLVIVVAQSTISSFPPSVQTPIIKDTTTMRGPTCHIHYLLSLQGVNELRSVTVPAVGG